MPRRITIVTAGHLATCPRMLKAADALHEAGYRVRVVSVRHTPWASAADARLRQTRAWRWDVVDASRTTAPARWLLNGIRFRTARALAGVLAAPRPHALAARAFGRVHDALLGEILRDPGDLVYGGTTGALAAVAAAGRRSGVRFAIDFEDFHCGAGDESAPGRLENELAAAIMQDALCGAAFVTAGSGAIAGACRERFGVDPVPVHNVFPLPPAPPGAAPSDAPRLYWFSQTIGPGRGLEDVVRGAGRLARRCELHLRGVSANGFVDGLRALAAAAAPQLTLRVHPPADPGTMVAACRLYTAGLATEPAHTVNSALLLSNKALTYPLAGLPVVLTTTPGHEAFAASLADGGCAVPPGDPAAVAEGLSRWLGDSGALRRARDASWEAARTRWHWEHPEERGALLRCVERVLA